MIFVIAEIAVAMIVSKGYSSIIRLCILYYNS